MSTAMIMILRLAILLSSCWVQTVFSAANVTVPDTDPSIVYSPMASWSSSSNLCSSCLNPGISVSFHEGINTADSTAASSTSSLVVSPGSTATPSPQSSSEAGSSTTLDSRRLSGKGALARQLPSDSGSVNTPVTLSYNFTGTAIYLFCIQPPSGASVNGTPTNLNLTFTLDSHPAGGFSPTETNTEFLPNQNVLSLDGLSDQPHQLVVTVGDDSVFLFSALIYTDSSASNSTAWTTQPGKKNNVAAFAGALGGTVGVLSLICLSIAISIIRRRILAARRDRLENEANPRSMIGPMPFVPRYFPDTVVPQDPPTYDDTLSITNPDNTSSRQRSYADIPPASSPPPLEELSPPPPFSLAPSAPVLELPIEVITEPLLSAETQTFGSPDSDVSGGSASSHEDRPLLQSSTRPLSTGSLQVETPENSETSRHQEEDAA